MIVFGESILIQWLSYFIFSLILLIVVILHDRDAKRICKQSLRRPLRLKRF